MSSIKRRIFTSTEKYIYHPTIPFCSVSDIPTLLGNMRGSQENDGGRNSCTPFLEHMVGNISTNFQKN